MHLCVWAGTLLSQQCSCQQDAAAAVQSWGHRLFSAGGTAAAQSTKAHINKTVMFGFSKMQISLFHARISSLGSFHESLGFVSVQNADILSDRNEKLLQQKERYIVQSFILIGGMQYDIRESTTKGLWKGEIKLGNC